VRERKERRIDRDRPKRDRDKDRESQRHRHWDRESQSQNGDKTDIETEQERTWDTDSFFRFYRNFLGNNASDTSHAMFTSRRSMYFIVFKLNEDFAVSKKRIDQWLQSIYGLGKRREREEGKEKNRREKRGKRRGRTQRRDRERHWREERQRLRKTETEMQEKKGEVSLSRSVADVSSLSLSGTSAILLVGTNLEHARCTKEYMAQINQYIKQL
jgi:hypothetical protein